ncbi:hypothetical protein CEXT_95311 [Caerostris extrusa]|uniref:Uncharacterized protein n=1 Tax=Caerostris extrusa TaxID=172846 RepID=A0AAV4PDW4_CAEEX|nr:hypothetical protein CEXT_95311 [Caerostris extrusa]
MVKKQITFSSVKVANIIIQCVYRPQCSRTCGFMMEQRHTFPSRGVTTAMLDIPGGTTGAVSCIKTLHLLLSLHSLSVPIVSFRIP